MIVHVQKDTHIQINMYTKSIDIHVLHTRIYTNREYTHLHIHTHTNNKVTNIHKQYMNSTHINEQTCFLKKH